MNILGAAAKVVSVVQRLRTRCPSLCLYVMRLFYIIRLDVSESGEKRSRPTDQKTRGDTPAHLQTRCARGVACSCVSFTVGDSLSLRLCILFLIFLELFCVCVRVGVSGVYVQRCQEHCCVCAGYPCFSPFLHLFLTHLSCSHLLLLTHFHAGCHHPHTSAAPPPPLPPCLPLPPSTTVCVSLSLSLCVGGLAGRLLRYTFLYRLVSRLCFLPFLSCLLYHQFVSTLVLFSPSYSPVRGSFRPSSRHVPSIPLLPSPCTSDTRSPTRSAARSVRLPVVVPWSVGKGVNVPE